MMTLPRQPADENVRALGMWYQERITGLTGTALTLTNTPRQTQDGQALVLLFKNGAYLDPTSGAPTYTWERTTGVVGTLLPLTHTPNASTLLLFKNGTLLDPTSDYSLSGSTVTLNVAAIAGDKFVAAYFYNASSYTLAGSGITLAVAAVAADVFDVFYPYRT